MSQPLRLTEADKSALHELADHINRTIDIIHNFNKGQANVEQLSSAFRRILRDVKSYNTLEGKLAKYIMDEVKLVKLKVKIDGDHCTAFDFLQMYWAGEIKDMETIDMGFKGIAGPVMLTLLKNCKADLILKRYS